MPPANFFTYLDKIQLESIATLQLIFFISLYHIVTGRLRFLFPVQGLHFIILPVYLLSMAGVISLQTCYSFHYICNLSSLSYPFISFLIFNRDTNHCLSIAHWMTCDFVITYFVTSSVLGSIRDASISLLVFRVLCFSLGMCMPWYFCVFGA